MHKKNLLDPSHFFYLTPHLEVYRCKCSFFLSNFVGVGVTVEFHLSAYLFKIKLSSFHNLLFSRQTTNSFWGILSVAVSMLTEEIYINQTERRFYTAKSCIKLYRNIYIYLHLFHREKV